ncbi:redoxin domain-containing protein [Nitrososphaera viennensis]|uniref:Redoxin domain-containing protein n=2 Tax=Nitrososphaera viennensis TaxID=1034015 RepID=A0A977IGF0_9ARCH|nr:redoxin domain-containing protein [Nitrososphaera viennensis]AIC15409.1 putative cytochrome c biogenesis protein, transmembrane region [Nitrososphaera viennensis EN76]UVS70302.1 redoxin domain-containing protein [Nitrososphaera viennensis]
MQLIPATPAPEFREISGWANSDPLSIKSLKGKVVILDCWTYTCIFCLRTIPTLKRLQEKYGKHGLQVVQAHSAEYHFATDHANISRALARYNVRTLPVAFDTKNKTWEAYGNMYWPKHVIIDHAGFVRYEHAGYGDITEFEPVIAELLEEAGNKPSSSVDYDDKNPDDEIFDTYGMHFAGMAPEICVGYSRMRRFGNNQTFRPDEPSVAVDPGTHFDNVVYLRGKWVWQREGVQFAPGGKETKPAVIMKYNSAKRVHGIMGTSDGRPGRAEVRLDGNSLTKGQLGRDAKLEENGASVVDIEWPFMHNLVRTEKPEVHEIEIIPRSDNFVFYTFVFG